MDIFELRNIELGYGGMFWELRRIWLVVLVSETFSLQLRIFMLMLITDNHKRAISMNIKVIQKKIVILLPFAVKRLHRTIYLYPQRRF